MTKSEKPGPEPVEDGVQHLQAHFAFEVSEDHLHSVRGDVLDVFWPQAPEVVGPCSTEDGAEEGENEGKVDLRRGGRGQAAQQGDGHGGGLLLRGKVALQPFDHPIGPRLGQGQVVASSPRGLHDGPEVDTGGSEGAAFLQAGGEELKGVTSGRPGLHAAGGAAGLVERLSLAVNSLCGGRRTGFPQRGEGLSWGHASHRCIELRTVWRHMGAPPGRG